jgi:hypothetical protein
METIFKIEIFRNREINAPENRFVVKGEWKPSKYEKFKVVIIDFKDFPGEPMYTIMPTSGIMVFSPLEGNFKKKITSSFKHKGVKIKPSKEGITFVGPCEPPQDFFKLPESEWPQIGTLNKDDIIILYNVGRVNPDWYHTDIYADKEKGEAWCYKMNKLVIYAKDSMFQ